MGEFPKQFPSIVSPSLVSFNWTDIASGTGYVTYYGANTVDNAVTSYFLTPNVIYSNNKTTYTTTGTTTLIKLFDFDFDILYNQAQRIKGVLIAQISWIQGQATSANEGGTSYVVIKVRKWDGSSETEIASNTKSEVHTVASLNSDGTTKLILVDIPTAQLFSRGETLRITVELWVDGQSNGTTAAICHDPQNRILVDPIDYPYGGGIEIDPDTSAMTFHVPHEIIT